MNITIKKIIMGLIPHGFLVIRDQIADSVRHSKYRGYKIAGGFGEKLRGYVDYVKKYTSLKVKNIFEIGANYAQDADYLMQVFYLTPDDVYVFEAHPELFQSIKKLHKFNAYHNAVFNEDKEITFHIFPLDYPNTGWSSVYKHMNNETTETKVQAIRMDSFMVENKIEKIDFLKIDVEGASLAVLEGFGERIKDVNCIQVEAEHLAEFSLYGAVDLYNKIADLLGNNGFELVMFARNNFNRQSDSFWIRKEYLVYR
jgi:FkbM family methyltransferase